MSTSFPYNPSVINALEASLSADRLASYLNQTGQDKEHALRLYVWNTNISAALYGPLQGLEVSLRNAMYRELSGVYRTQWRCTDTAAWVGHNRTFLETLRQRP